MSRILIAEDERQLAAFLQKGLRELRGRSVRMPVLVLTARGGVEDAVAAFEAGADDYLTKPFAFDELLARLRARFRAGECDAPSPQLTGADVELDLHRRRVIVDGAHVDLTDREFGVLEALLSRPGEALARDELVARVWGDRAGVAANIVEVYVSLLRRKPGAERIETIRGVGYRMPAWSAAALASCAEMATPQTLTTPQRLAAIREQMSLLTDYL